MNEGASKRIRKKPKCSENLVWCERKVTAKCKMSKSMSNEMGKKFASLIMIFSCIYYLGNGKCLIISFKKKEIVKEKKTFSDKLNKPKPCNLISKWVRWVPTSYFCKIDIASLIQLELYRIWFNCYFAMGKSFFKRCHKRSVYRSILSGNWFCQPRRNHLRCLSLATKRKTWPNNDFLFLVVGGKHRCHDRLFSCIGVID